MEELLKEFESVHAQVSFRLERLHKYQQDTRKELDNYMKVTAMLNDAYKCSSNLGLDFRPQLKRIINEIKDIGESIDRLVGPVVKRPDYIPAYSWLDLYNCIISYAPYEGQICCLEDYRMKRLTGDSCVIIHIHTNSTSDKFNEELRYYLTDELDGFVETNNMHDQSPTAKISRVYVYDAIDAESPLYALCQKIHEYQEEAKGNE